MYSFSPEVLRTKVQTYPNQCPICGNACQHTDEEKARCLGLHRGESVYDRLERDGWRSIPPPHCMRGTDCYRKGNRRAFIEHVTHDGLGYCRAREGFPSVDGFRQRYWRTGDVIGTDENFPANYQE